MLGLLDLPVVAPRGGRSLLQHPGCPEGRALGAFVQFNLKGTMEKSAGDLEERLLGPWGWALLARAASEPGAPGAAEGWCWAAAGFRASAVYGLEGERVPEVGFSVKEAPYF